MSDDLPSIGDRWVRADHVVDSVIVTGDGNVVIYYADGQRAAAAAPASRAEAESLLFGPVPAVIAERPWAWITPEATVHDVVERPEQAQLMEWAVHGRGTAVRLVSGPSGQGKTTLARQVCSKLVDLGWTAGVLDLEHLQPLSASAGERRTGRMARAIRQWESQLAAIAALPRLSNRALLVVDPADWHLQQVEEMLETVAALPSDQGVPAVKLLLLARDTGEWWDQLVIGSRRHRWVERDPVRLAPLTQTISAPQIDDLWWQALTAFHRKAGQAGMSVPNLVDLPRGRPAAFRTTLDLYAGALLQVLDASSGRDAGHAYLEDPLVGLVEHELRYLVQTMDARGIPTSYASARRILGLVCLHSPSDQVAALNVLRRLDPAASEDHLSEISQTLQVIYTGTGGALWRALRPDRLAETIVRSLAAETRSDSESEQLLLELCGTDDWYIGRICAQALIRALDARTYEHDRVAVDRRLNLAVGTLISRHPRGYVATALELVPGRFEDQLRAAILAKGGTPTRSALRISDLESLDSFLRGKAEASHSGKVLAVAVSQRLVDAATAEPPALLTGPWQKSLRIYNLAWYALRLRDVGESERAAVAAEQAAALAQEMDTPTTFTSVDNAVLLSHAGEALADARMPHEALSVAAAAVACLAQASPMNEDPSPSAGQSAAIISAHAQRLTAVGHHNAAAAQASRAFVLYRIASEQESSRYDAQAAAAQGDFGLKLLKTELVAQAEGHLEEAVFNYRHCAAADEPTGRNILSAMLQGLGYARRTLGRGAEAVPVLLEALEYERELAARNPAVRVIALTTALNSLGAIQLEAGDPAGIEYLKEAADRLRACNDDPAAQDHLAAVLGNLGAAYGQLGDLACAAALLQEASTLRSELGMSSPPFLSHGLAHALDAVQSGEGARPTTTPETPRSQARVMRSVDEARAEVPPITPDLLAEAQRWRGGSLYVIDPMFDPDGEIPGHGVRGYFPVNEQGEPGEYRHNERYRPSPAALCFPDPTDPLDLAAQLALTGYAADTDVLRALTSAMVSTPTTADPPSGTVEVFTSQAHVPSGTAVTRIQGTKLLASLPPDTTVHINPAGLTPFALVPPTRTPGRSGDDKHEDKVAQLCRRYTNAENVIGLIVAELHSQRIWYLSTPGHINIAKLADGQLAVFVYSSRSYASTEMLDFAPGVEVIEANIREVIEILPQETMIVINNEGPHPIRLPASRLRIIDSD